MRRFLPALIAVMVLVIEEEVVSGAVSVLIVVSVSGDWRVIVTALLTAVGGTLAEVEIGATLVGSLKAASNPATQAVNEPIEAKAPALLESFQAEYDTIKAFFG